ncbi:4-aminobutyrate--2-oxoglutarate transaminase, partial [Cronobacter sakazakii]|uniref:aminotransferase class III-fold pyridoxal phosphate-dependent enzyme n=1 Tax=Cronobacter sakazakii TaxID=28141 RepID=UPI000D51E98C
VQPYKKGYGPFPAGIYHAPYPAAYLGVSDTQALASLAGVFAAGGAPGEGGAVIIEPVQGEGGVFAASAE